MTDDALHPARRFLHVCYCTTDAEAVSDFFAAGLGLRATMRTPMERNSGEIFGMDGEIESEAIFVYDPRGPRRAPAIEVQGWREPAIVGEAQSDPTAVGIQSLGYGVSDLDAAVDALVGLGSMEVSRGAGTGGSSTVVLRDPTGVHLDIVDVPGLAAPEMRHLRITVTDLDVSIPWYEGLGWTVIERVQIADPAGVGLPDGRTGEVARLRLPDEATETHLVQWVDPASHGRHPSEAYHAGIFRVALGVDDTRASHAAMSAEGWDFDRSPLEIELNGTPVPDMWICFISDPDGIPYEFVQRPRSAFRQGR